jgi:16S rRNA (adenine1518-N6/adenine1519-N6)-dimethyltransferase
MKFHIDYYKKQQKKAFKKPEEPLHWTERKAALEMPRKKKAFGQHFLRKQSVVDHMIDKVKVTTETSVLEIGCGDGFLTQSVLLQTPCKRLWCFEIDPEWADVVSKKIKDPRLTIKLEDVLQADLGALAEHTPWVVLANLPYQITFPIIFAFQKHKHLFTEGVIMVQEEVAQKIVAQGGRGENTTSLFLQYHFDWELLDKIEPGAFTPPPKVHSRLLYFKPRFDAPIIADEEKFWQFVKFCFKSPRQMIRNNLKMTHYANSGLLPDEILTKRAQQMDLADFINIWDQYIAGKV